MSDARHWIMSTTRSAESSFPCSSIRRVHSAGLPLAGCAMLNEPLAVDKHAFGRFGKTVRPDMNAN